jgi:hypothetical protein
MKPSYPSSIALVALIFLYLGAGSARANVYATDIRLNGSLRHGVILSGTSVTISYILNDTATAGVSVQILRGTNVIKTFASATSTAGTNAGLNTIVWDGSTDDESPLTNGLYTVSISAASTGYDDWTNITDDGTNFDVNSPRGVAVDQNTNSPYYGRVFVANANTPYGIYKYNADGSPGDESGFSPWIGGDFLHYSPWKVAISRDDRVYVDDFSSGGEVYAFDPMISTNHFWQAVRPDNYPAQDQAPQLSGLAVTGSGTNTQIWMADSCTNSAGIIVWAATNGMAAMNDQGTIVAPVDSTNSLSEGPYDLDLDTNGNIYTIQFITTTDNPADALMSFPPFEGIPETNTTWAVGYSDPSLLDAYGVAVDPTATYVAVAVVGPCPDTENSPCGGLNLYSATNGQFLMNLDQTGGDAYYDVAWDKVGNLYALDWTAGVWRAYSPPGTNQATTVAVPFIQAYTSLQPPLLHNPSVSGDNLSFTLVGQSNISYVIQSSCDLSNWTDLATNFSTNANRLVVLPATNVNQNFYQAVTLP